MKFTDGYWHIKEGYTIFNPVEIRDIAISDRSITVYAACRSVVTRGDTLNAPLLTITYSAARADVIRVQVAHHLGGHEPYPQFALTETHESPSIANVTDDDYCLRSGKLEVRIRKQGPWLVSYYYDGKRLTGNGTKSTGYILAPDGTAYVREQLNLSVGELVYGLGERFGPWLKNGQSIDIWNEDGGTSSEQAYKNIPFYLTNQGYGVLVNHAGRVSYEIASENVSRVQFSVPGEQLDYLIIGGARLQDVLTNYTALTGRPALPPAWSFGLWLTTSFTTSYDEQTVNHFIDGMQARNLPLHVFHFDCFWMKEYQWCDFKWDAAVFPEPAAMLSRLKQRDLHICAWINPYIAQKSCLFAEGKSLGYLVKRPDGSVWQWDRWQAGMALVDFTNPDATAWFQAKLRALLEMGVDCFKTDFGERIPTDVIWHDGSDPMLMHNYYTFLYNKAVFDLLTDTRGAGDAVLFARSATVGGQQFPVHWGGDCAASYESMAETLRGGLSLALGGFGFWSHDISGFEKTATPDLFKRWTAFGLLSSHSRLHGNESYRVPWLFDEQAVDVLRHFTNLKCQLMPTLYAAACQAADAGIPVMRPMILSFPEDKTCAYLDQQYMLGDSLLVAPVFSADGNVSYYLPDGNWTHLLSNQRVSGGRWIRETYDYMSLPLFVKPGSMIAIGNNNQRPDYDYLDGITFHLFELADGKTASLSITSCQSPAVEKMAIQIQRTGQTLTVQTSAAAKPWQLVLRNIAQISSLAGGSAAAGPDGVVITPDGSGKPVQINIP